MQFNLRFYQFAQKLMPYDKAPLYKLKEKRASALLYTRTQLQVAQVSFGPVSLLLISHLQTPE